MTTLQKIQATGITPVAFNVISEMNKQGKEVQTIYAVTGNALAGYYINTIIGGRIVVIKGTPSSNGKKPYKRLPAYVLNSYTWINS